jgi:signal transduction histidine kinase
MICSGHHLTALSLNLEVASHVATGPAQERVRQAQSLARLLLSDVRDAVSTLRAEDRIDLTEGAHDARRRRARAADPPRDSRELHRRRPEARAGAAALRAGSHHEHHRHAGARNLWIKFERGLGGDVRMHAEDDGRGASALEQGNGLTA